jgi:hypothetical protein
MNVCAFAVGRLCLVAVVCLAWPLLFILLGCCCLFGLAAVVCFAWLLLFVLLGCCCLICLVAVVFLLG